MRGPDGNGGGTGPRGPEEPESSAPEPRPGPEGRPEAEEHLEALRRQALREGQVEPRGGGVGDVDVLGGPLPPGRAADAETPDSRDLAGTSAGPTTGRVARRGRELPGYYGMPVVKPPVWTWEVPLYFFVGGLSGMSAVIGAASLALDDDEELARAALWIAAAGTPVSTGLLIADLGRPARFLNMLRVFKWRSPMSVGAWVLVAFGACVVPAAALAEPRLKALPRGAPASLRRAALAATATGSAGLGAVLATYTGVLIGATAIPAWLTHRRLLPVHFGTAGLGSAAALLELLGLGRPALHALGFLTAAAETGVAAATEVARKGAADRAVREGRSGTLLRAAGLLAGPVALGLRAFGFRRLAGASFLAGALASRYGWMEAGRASGKDPDATLSSG